MNLKIKSFAKINIGLNVYEKEKNNKHKIMSIFMLIDNYYDDIEIIESKENSILYLIDSKKINIENDVVSKVLNFLNNKKGLKKYFNIKINKTIPFNAGLGGSSSNAGTILNAICDYYNIILTYDDLEYIALELGSDIPFFTSGYQIALVSNYGDEVYDLSYLPKPNYQLIPCYWNIPTKFLYEKYDLITHNQPKNDFKFIIKNWDKLDKLNITNDLFIPSLLISQKYHNFFNLISKKYNNKFINMTGSGSFLYYLKNR